MGGGTFSLELEDRVASSIPFLAAAVVVEDSIKTNLADPAGSLQSSSVSLEEASSTKRVYLVTFPSDLGNVAKMGGFGVDASVSVTVTDKTQGAVQVKQKSTWPLTDIRKYYYTGVAR